MKFHHVGIPTTLRRPGEAYLAEAKLFVTDAAASPHQIEWLRFEPDSPMPNELKTRPHVAFEVADLQAAMRGKKIVIEPFTPMPGLQVGFVMDDDALIEYMQKTH